MNEAAMQHAPATKMWLPAQALDCYEGNARLRSWLTEDGLMTARMRAAGGAAFRLNVIGEATDATGHLRAIELLCGDRVWLYAETRVPAPTLARHPWLARIGKAALGEVLAARTDLARDPFEFARELPESQVVSRALERAGLTAQPLWVRRTRYQVGGAPFVLREVFFPGTGALD
ncbi:MAG: chorismate lyase [Steroidobacteraceae bacterium]